MVSEENIFNFLGQNSKKDQELHVVKPCSSQKDTDDFTSKYSKSSVSKFKDTTNQPKLSNDFRVI